MKLLLLCVLVLVAVQATPFDSTGQARLISEHNRARVDAVPPPATKMQDITWSAAAATQANNWANACNYKHSSGTGFGENIYAGSGHRGTNQVALVDSSFGGWESEESGFAFDSNGNVVCTHPQTCGHYTQIVWANTGKIGCAYAHCSTNSPFGSSFPTWTFVVCNYEGPGNYIGQKPYVPCTSGNCGTTAASVTPTRTRTPAASVTPSRTRTPAAVASATPSRTRTPATVVSATPSRTRTPVASVTPSRTRTPATVGSVTPSRTRTPSRSFVCNNPCTTNQCGYVTDNCGKQINCGSCATNQACAAQNGVNTCVSNPTCNPLQECANLNSQCGNRVVCGVNTNCGTCPSGQICQNYQCRTDPCSSCGQNMQCVNSACQCLAGFTLVNGQCVLPTSGGTPSWSTDFSQIGVGGMTVPDIVLIQQTTGSNLVRWDRTAAVVDKYTTRHNFNIQTNTGTFAVAFRVGQGTSRTADRVEFRWSGINGATANLKWCLVYYGTDYCSDFGSRSFPSANGVKLATTMGYDDANGDLICTVTVGNTYYSGYTDGSYFPQLGAVGYFFNTGSSSARPTLSELVLATSATLTVSLTDCIDDSEWAQMFYDLTGANPATTRVQIRGSGENANCKAAGQAKELVSGFTFVVTSISVPAQGLASTFVSSVGTPAGAAAGITSAGVVAGSEGAVVAGLPGATGALPGSVATASAGGAVAGGGGGAGGGLSGGAIAGIVIGSVAGGVLLLGLTALIVGAVIVGAIVLTRNSDDDSSSSASPEDRRSVRRTIRGFFGGVDVMNDPKGHQSITARSPPMK